MFSRLFKLLSLLYIFLLFNGSLILFSGLQTSGFMQGFNLQGLGIGQSQASQGQSLDILKQLTQEKKAQQPKKTITRKSSTRSKLKPGFDANFLKLLLATNLATWAFYIFRQYLACIIISLNILFHGLTVLQAHYGKAMYEHILAPISFLQQLKQQSQNQGSSQSTQLEQLKKLGL